MKKIISLLRGILFSLLMFCPTYVSASSLSIKAPEGFEITRTFRHNASSVEYKENNTRIDVNTFIGSPHIDVKMTEINTGKSFWIWARYNIRHTICEADVSITYAMAPRAGILSKEKDFHIDIKTEDGARVITCRWEECGDPCYPGPEEDKLGLIIVTKK